MKRKNFLRSIGLAGIAGIVPGKSSGASALSFPHPGADCVLIPSETAGPFPVDLSGEGEFFRTDITEGKPGLPLTLILTIVNVNDNCAPIANSRVDVWHCDKDGYYSGFTNSGYLGTINNVGETFCRGIQMTDANGKVTFTSIYPGWYPGRVQHIHFQVFIGATLQATSQLAFPDSINDEVNLTGLYAAHGINPTTNTGDGIFNSPPGDLEYELSAVTGNTKDGYTAELTVGISAPVGTAISNFEPETGGQFTLAQNAPNPASDLISIPFTLTNASQVLIALYDLNAQKIAELYSADLPSGTHAAEIALAPYKLAPGNYLYELQCVNAFGTHRQCKVMTIQ
ncbi:MAG: hypothetical protein R2794_07365 [Chitinophagales bacterium]